MIVRFLIYLSREINKKRINKLIHENHALKKQLKDSQYIQARERKLQTVHSPRNFNLN